MIQKVKKIIDLENNEKNKEDDNNISNENNDFNNKVIENGKGSNNDNSENQKEANLNKNYQNSKDDNISNDTKKLNKEEKNENDPIITYMASINHIKDEDLKNSSKLILEEIDCNLFNGKKIEINAAGMIGGRGKKDGFTIFGQKNINEDSDMDDSKLENQNPFYPDYELNYSPYLSYPYIFAIYYKKEEKSFYIKAYSGKGSDNKVLFIKLDNKNKFILNQKELILSGNMIFQVTPINDCNIEIINLSKKKYNISNKYNFDGFIKKKFTIGRQKECDFSFPKEKAFSRCQTTFEYDKAIKKWTIIDGNKDRASTNGTWIFGTHSFIIKDEIIVEILNCQIKITEIKNSNSGE